MGYAADPSYTGSLTTTANRTLVASTTYTGLLFDGAGSTVAFTGSAAGVTFNGCYFGMGGSVAGVTFTGNGPVTFNHCTFGPSPAVVGGGFPPLPPSGGGYSTWPSQVGSTPGQSPGITTGNYQYGPVTDGGASVLTGGFACNSCDLWGCGNGAVFGPTGASNSVTWNNSWIHDCPNNSFGYHNDGVGWVNSGPVVLASVTVTGCTIASYGNTQGIGMQMGSTDNMTNFTITNNYFAGWQYTLNMGNVSGFTPGTYTNIVVTGNTIGHALLSGGGQMYGTYTTPFNTGGSGNKWRNNTFDGGTYTGAGVVPAGYFLWPDGSANATDWTGAY